MLKPSPSNIRDLYIGSLKKIGINPAEHDLRWVEDDWESPTLGAAGLGWEVWCDGMEVTQFTYFQQVAGLECRPVAGEITYGLERLAMFIFGKESVYDLPFSAELSYGDIYHQNEVEYSHFNFTHADTATLFKHFADMEQQCTALLAQGLPLPAYDFCILASHVFNLLNACGVIAVTERAGYIGRVRALAKGCADGYLAAREKLGFPLLKTAMKGAA
jgi:glycyl-tRNA synthetase alpha chain